MECEAGRTRPAKPYGQAGWRSSVIPFSGIAWDVPSRPSHSLWPRWTAPQTRARRCQSGWPYSPSQCARRPLRLTARRRRSASSRCWRVVTMSISSPVRSWVSGGDEGLPVADDQRDDARVGSRSSRIVTPSAGATRASTVIVSSSASRTSRGADSTAICRVALAGRETQQPRQRGQDRSLDQREEHDEHEDDVEQVVAAGHPAHDRERGEHDRHRPAQAGPGQERLLAHRNTERQPG